MLDLPGPPYALPGLEVLQRLGSDSQQGLSAEEVIARRAKFGRNIFETAAPEPGWRKFLHQFEGPVIWILLATSLAPMLVVELGKHRSDRWRMSGRIDDEDRRFL